MERIKYELTNPDADKKLYTCTTPCPHRRGYSRKIGMVASLFCERDCSSFAGYENDDDNKYVLCVFAEK